MKTFNFCGLLILCSIFCACKGQQIKPHSLTVGEFYENPIGYNLEDLTFSWKLPQGDNVSQSAYQIIVGTSPDLSKGIVWDSGKVESSQSVKIPYPNKVDVRQKLYWKVKVWDNHNNESKFSDINFFEAGINSEDWNANWLSSPDNPEPQDTEIPFMGDRMKLKYRTIPPSYFRKEFELKNDIKKARLYLTCRGIAKSYLNGEIIGDDYWSTGWTEYAIRAQSNTYDITKNLKKGKNAVGIALADGWYCGTQAWCYIVRAKNPPLERFKPDVMLQIEVEYIDGTKETIATDSSWKFSYGARLSADIYDGEIYDSRKEFIGWTSPNFNDVSWQTPQLEKYNNKTPLIEPRRCEPIKCTKVFEATKITKTGNGTFLLDFGQNFAGIPELDMPALPSGTEVKIECAEILVDGKFYKKNYTTAKSTDIYISNGKPFKWKPMFTYHGFRYLQVSGLPNDFNLTKQNVKGLVLRTASRMAGTFECSDPLVNKLQSNIQWGQRSNFFSTPTDCPQRAERMGFTGDAQVFMPTALFNMNLNAFFMKWMTDLNDAQSKEGIYPYYAPNLPKYTHQCAGWSDCGVICPWENYLFYGDTKILRRNYDGMKKWVMFQKKMSKNLIGKNIGIGDWLQPKPKPKKRKRGIVFTPDTPNDLISTAYFIRTSAIMAKVAKVLGKQADAEEFTKLTNDIKKAYQKRFVKADGTVEGDCQTAYLMTLSNDIISDKQLEKLCFEKFLKCLERDNWYLNTGFLGTPLLNPTLARFGRNDIAFKLLMNKKSPSWLFAVEQGATTIWESWAGYDTMSFNHYAYGAVGEWLYKDVAGLWHDEQNAGFKNIIFAPKFKGIDFKYAKATYETPYGLAESKWQKDGKKIVWNIKIPSNSTGSICLPADELQNATINGKSAKNIDVKNIPSGNYTIEILM